MPPPERENPPSSYMENPQPSLMRSDDQTTSLTAHLLLALFGLFAPLFTYLLAVSRLSAEIRIAGLALVAVVYALICVWSFGRLRADRFSEPAYHATDPGFYSKLDALDDARYFFGNSLKPGDMFRLVSSRVGDIVPHTSAMLLVADRESDVFRVSEIDGMSETDLAGDELPTGSGVAGMAYLSGDVEIDRDLRLSSGLFNDEFLEGVKAMAAIPLMHEGSTFGVFQMFLSEAPENIESTRSALEAIGGRIAPLFLGSISFERSLSNALTDPLTGLPNERAFFMVLENQLAESHRFREERPLTILAIDIKGFDEMNRDLGHVHGDKILKFVSEGIRGELRKMDFLARSMNDEFLIVLPTATGQMANDVMSRIIERFSELEYPINEHQNMKIWLNFGSATFWQDGETAKQLLNHANVRKAQAKSEDADNIFWFPKEYVN